MPAAKGLARITEVVNKADDVVQSGIGIRSKVEAIWGTSQGLYDGLLVEVKSVDDLVNDYKSKGLTLSNLVETKNVAVSIKDFVIKCRTDVNSMYDNANQIKDLVYKIREDANYIIKELAQWRQVKKELELELNQTKLKILKALKTCQNMAKAKFKEAKEDFAKLQRVLDAVGNADFSRITASDAESIKNVFNDMLDSDTFHIFTSKEHDRVDKMKDAIKDKLKGQLDTMLSGAVDYVKESEEWKKVVAFENSINTLISSVGELLTTSDKKETRQQTTIEGYITKWQGEITNYLGNGIDVAIDGAFNALAPGVEVAKKLFAAYKFASNVLNAFKNVPESLDKFLPYTYTHDFLKDEEYSLFDFSVKIPVASIGWISVTAGAGINGKVVVSLAASGTIYNFLDPNVNEIVSGNVTGSAVLTIEGYLSLGVDLLGIVDAEARAALEATVSVTDARGEVLLQKETKNPGEAGISLKSNAALTFALKGKLQFHIELTYFIRKLVKAVTNWDAQKTWTLAEMTLIEKTTNVGFETMLTFDNSRLPNFGAIVDTLKSIGNLSTTAREKIQQAIEEKFGKKDKLKEAAHGASVTAEDVTDLISTYNIELQGETQE